MIILNARNIEKTYSNGGTENKVLKSVDLLVKKGEFLSVMGPSGSGKSTLLYNVSGMDRMSGGSVVLGESNLEALSEKDLSSLRLHKMGFIFQQIHLLKNLTLKDNIVATAYLAGKQKRKDIDLKAENLMEKTGIADLADHDITQASGGQLQRAAICRAIINDPEILFGDEPTGALNSKSANEIMDILEELNREGMTIMLVTHDVKVAARTGRVLFMKDGRIVGEYKNDIDGITNREVKLNEWLLKQGF